MTNEYCIIELQRYTFHLLTTFTKRENVQAGTKGRPDEDESCFGKHHELISLFGLLFQLLHFLQFSQRNEVKGSYEPGTKAKQ